MDSLCFCKNFTNQIFTFMSSSKVVYFKKHLVYQAYYPQETKFALLLNVLYCRQKINLAVKTMTKSLHT